MQERVVTQQVEGSVTAYTSRTLSLETKRSDSGGHIEEMLVPVDPAVTRFDRVASIHDLERGDRVRVQYRQSYRRDERNDWVLTGVTATKITFLNHAIGGPNLRGASDGGGS
jgi:hypothetical protein